LQNNENLDENISRFSQCIYDCSFESFGKVINTSYNKKHKKTEWFNEECKLAKARFLNDKRKLKLNGTDINKISFLESRKYYCTVKRRAQNNYSVREKRQLSDLSRKSPKSFWKKLTDFEIRVNPNQQILI
jgi:hypothetical protein